MTSFINAIRSEWTKVSTLRSTWVTAILLVGSLAGPVFLMGLFSQPGSEINNEMLTIGSMIFLLIAIAFAGSTVAGEYNDHMHAHAFLSQDRRSLWLIARTLVVLAFLLVTAAIGIGLASVIALVMPNFTYVGGPLEPIWRLGLSVVIFALIAIAISVLTRSRVAAVAIPLVWIVVVENLLGLAAYSTKVARFVWFLAPFERISQVTGGSPGVFGVPMPVMREGWEAGALQPMWFNVAVLVLWIALTFAASLWSNARRDVK